MAQALNGSLKTGSLTRTHWLAILLALATGVIHVYAGIVEGRIPILLAGLGFLGAVVLFLLDYRRTLLYIVGIVYTTVQIPLWYVVKAGEYTMLGYVDKSIQVVFILLLVYLYWSERDVSTARRESPTA
jgi:hypothetical protein